MELVRESFALQVACLVWVVRDLAALALPPPRHQALFSAPQVPPVHAAERDQQLGGGAR